MNDKNNRIITEAVVELASAIESGQARKLPPATDEREVFWTICQHVMEATGIQLHKPITLPTSDILEDILFAVTEASGCRFRKVLLSGEWWKEDSGALLAFDIKTNRPLSLTQKKHTYYLFDAFTGKETKLSKKIAETLHLEAYAFYRTFPDKILNLKTLLSFGFKDHKREIAKILLLQVCIGLLGLLIPIATAILLDRVIPNAETNALGQWIFILTSVTFSIAMFQAAQIIGLLRLRLKMNVSLQAAVWDRLLRLPMNFFHEYTPGDLSVRASGIDTIQQALAGTILQSIFSGIFSFISFALMFYYAPSLALVALAITLLIILLLMINAKIQLDYQRPILKLKGYLSNLTLEYLTAINKLRVGHKETQAFSLWTKSFAKKNRLDYQSEKINIYFSMTSMFLVSLGTVIFFALVGAQIFEISFESFIGFNAVFGQFFVALIGFFSAFITLIELMPEYERIQPILKAVPEGEKGGIAIPYLKGAIALKNINFRYDPEGSWILENISLDIKPGEIVAFAGITGSGKSTLMRLLLGFEKPTHGIISYDKHPLKELNLQSLRHQIGVVLQNSQLFPGSIYENIRGTNSVSMETVWELAEKAGIAQDIHAMSMGMHTIIAEGAKTISVGQRQRIMIARALARNPKILILDEATSAVDNPTQHAIMQHLASLNMTRIVVAHRLSTLLYVDKIFVMEKGAIVQVGSYQSLMSEKGLFAELAKHQLA